MKLVPWKLKEGPLDLFDDLEEFQREMNRLFDLNLHHTGRRGNGGALWASAVDVVDEKDQIHVKAEIPGMKKEDIEVALDNNILTLKGEKREEKEVKEKDYVRSERYYGSFHRSFTLPATVDASKINAVYKDGVLEITLPKKEEAKAKQIKVDVK